MENTKGKASTIIAQTILDNIRDKKLLPGDPLPSERELAREFGLGRPTVRQALQDLALMGVIRIKHGEKTRVCLPDMDNILDRLTIGTKHLLNNSSKILNELKEARVMFESQVVAAAVVLSSPEDEEELEEIILKQEEFASNHNLFLKYDIQFHVKIAAMTQNSLILTISRSILEWLKEHNRKLISVIGAEHITIKEHRQIFAAIQNKDSEKSIQAMRRHLLRLDEDYRQFTNPTKF